jgi:uncharacterized OsmC-like protein
MTKAISRHWTIRVVSEGSDPLSVTIDDRPFDSGVPGQLGSVSPVEYLLISIAACFALSCRMALTQRQLPAASFHLTVVGSKALDPPSRLDTIDIEIQFPGNFAYDVDSIIRQAKELCTVTNTLARPRQPEVRVRIG